MSDLPVYQKHRAIEPAPVVGGFRETYSQLGKATSIIGEVGARMAQSASNQFATIKGQEAAERNPGMKLMPAFTESDKHFQQAFEKQAYNDAVSSNQQLLQKLYTTTMSQPLTADSANLFTNNYSQGSSAILQNVPQSIRTTLQNNFQDSYNKFNFNLQNQLAHQSQQNLIGSFQNNFNTSLESLYSDAYGGFSDSAKKTLDDETSNVDFAFSQNYIDIKEAKHLKDMLQETHTLGYHNGVIANKFAQKNGEEVAAKYIANFGKNNPDISSIKKVKIEEKMLKEFHRLKAMKADNENIEYLNFAIESNNNGGLPPASLERAQDVLGSHAFKKLLYKETKNNAIYAKISASTKNGEFLEGLYKSKDVQNSYDRMVNVAAQDYASKGMEFGFLDKVMIAEQFNDSRLQIVKEIKNKALNGSAKDIEEASIAMKRNGRINEHDKKVKYLDGIGSEARFVAGLYDLHSSDKTKSPEEHAEFARKKVNSMNPREVEAADEIFDQITKKKGTEARYKLYDTVALSEKLSKDLRLKGWFKDGKVPGELIGAYKDAMLNGYRLTSNMELSHDEAIRLLKLKCGKTKANGKTQDTMYPLENTFPFKTINRQRNDLVIQVEPIFKSKEELFKKGSGSEYFKFAEGALKLGYQEDYVFDSPIFKSKEINVVRVYKSPDGKQIIEEPGYLETKADYKTGMPSMGIPSYSIVFKRKDAKNTLLPEITVTNQDGFGIRYLPTVTNKEDNEIKFNKLKKDTESRKNEELERELGHPLLKGSFQTKGLEGNKITEPKTIEPEEQSEESKTIEPETIEPKEKYDKGK